MGGGSSELKVRVFFFGVFEFLRVPLEKLKDLNDWKDGKMPIYLRCFCSRTGYPAHGMSSLPGTENAIAAACGMPIPGATNELLERMPHMTLGRKTFSN